MPERKRCRKKGGWREKSGPRRSHLAGRLVTADLPRTLLFDRVSEAWETVDIVEGCVWQSEVPAGNSNQTAAAASDEP